MSSLVDVCCCRRKRDSVQSASVMERVEIFDTVDKACEFLGHVIEEKAKKAIEKHDKFVIGLSGGSLCSQLCQGLPRINTEWNKWTLLFCDERVVGFDDDDSTFKGYKESLCSVTPLTAEQFVVIKPELSTKEAAEDYESKLRTIYPNVELPNIDLLLLGIGPDGHTCSLFPGHALLEETEKWVAAIEDSPKPPPCRVTLTYPVINNASCGIFVVVGAGKAEIIKRLLKDKEDLPAGRVKPSELLWILDQSAASML